MLKKSIKKLLAVTLTTVTLVTSAMPVSASTLTPKKSHKDSEVQERVLYLIDAADDIAISPWYDAPYLDSGEFSYRKKINSYRALQMCNMLLATPNLDSACSSETVAELKKARNTWKSACYANYMYMFYNQVWSDTAIVADDNVYPAYRTYFGTKPGKNDYNKVQKKATSSYNRVKKYIEKYQKYNPKFAAWLTRMNKNKYKGYKNLVAELKKMTSAKEKKIVNRWGTVEFVVSVDETYKCFGRVARDNSIICNDTLSTKVGTWYWTTKGMTPFNGSKNSPHNVFMRNTKYTAW